MGESPADWRALLDRAAAGDGHAWSDIRARVGHLGATLYSSFRTLTRPDWEDIVQDTMVRLLQTAEHREIRGNSDGEIRLYVRTMMRNRAIDLCRRPRAELVATERLVPEPAVPSAEAAQQARLMAERFLSAYPADWHDIFLWKLQGNESRTIRRWIEVKYGLYLSSATIDTRWARMKSAFAAWVRSHE
jgi:DNA-directed RNA polymerase specialized sigma24 family protein